MPGLNITTPPAVTPVTLAEAKAQSNVEHADDDTYLTRLIEAASARVADETWRALIETQYTQAFDGWPSSGTLELGRGPLISVDSIVYDDPDGVEQTWDPAEYWVDDFAPIPTVGLSRDSSGFPSVDLRQGNTVRVLFKAGYGTAPADVQAELRQAVLLIVASWYENREDVSLDGSGSILPNGAQRAMDMHSLRIID